MSYTREREDFLIKAGELGLRTIAQSLLRHATTLQRLAEAQCNGDWPCDNGERATLPCVRCGMSYVPEVLNKAGRCPDCRACDRVSNMLDGTPYKPYFQGDPRGAVLRLMPKDASEADIQSGRERGIYVPAR